MIYKNKRINTYLIQTLLKKSSSENVLHQVFLKLLQNLKESTCARASFLIKLQAEAWILGNF